MILFSKFLKQNDIKMFINLNDLIILIIINLECIICLNISLYGYFINNKAIQLNN